MLSIQFAIVFGPDPRIGKSCLSARSIGGTSAGISRGTSAVAAIGLD
jgi:hypothetical protein